MQILKRVGNEANEFSFQGQFGGTSGIKSNSHYG